MKTIPPDAVLKYLSQALLELTRQEGQAIDTSQWDKMESLLRCKRRLLSRMHRFDLRVFDKPHDTGPNNTQEIHNLLNDVAALETRNRASLQEKMRLLQMQMRQTQNQWKIEQAYKMPPS